MNEIDKVIFDIFNERWVGEGALKNIDTMKAQLHKTLTDQTRGYWSGHTAYHLAVDIGFLVDGDSNTKKKLTRMGAQFMNSMTNDLNLRV